MKKIILVLLIVITAVLAAGIKAKEQTTITKGKISATENRPGNITEQTQQYKVTFVELGSVKCVPCQMMQPVRDQVAQEYPAVEVVFHDVWTREGAPYAKKYGIRGIPTQVFLDEDGKEYYRHVGYFPKEELVKVLEQGLKQ